MTGLCQVHISRPHYRLTEPESPGILLGNLHCQINSLKDCHSHKCFWTAGLRLSFLISVLSLLSYWQESTVFYRDHNYSSGVAAHSQDSTGLYLQEINIARWWWAWGEIDALYNKLMEVHVPSIFADEHTTLSPHLTLLSQEKGLLCLTLKRKNNL